MKKKTYKHEGFPLTLAQHRACIYLERKGYKFLGHFGIDNAVEYAKIVRKGGKL